MIKTLTNLFKQDKEKFVVPKGVQDVIPVAAIFDDGIFKVGKDKYSKTYRFTDINYAVASREDKEAMFLEYSELLNSLDSGATTKITINNRRLNRLDFEQTILIPTTGDNLDEYREEYNKMLLDKATGANSIVQDKYITISINKKSVEDARTYFARVGADLIAHFGRLGSKCVELETDERLRIFHDFYRVGDESSFHFDIKETRKKGHDFKDYICPDTMEFEKDYFKMGNRYGRVLFLREYASYMNDGSMFTGLMKYRNKSFWEGHKTITFDTLTDRHRYEVIAVFKTVVYTDSSDSFKYYEFTDAENAAEFDAYVVKCKELSLYDTGVSAEYGDKLISLSTCEYSRNNGRLVVVAKRVD
ncbi:class B sortase [Dorea sp. 210702-DFI.3.17]|nr:class B sortase [Dorea sp. 210702-DFI.3.17]MCB6490513.1 class B sortase [Dorea sp. 210702-DFI.3.17]